MPDLVLADRIRSTIGPLEKRLDLPHVHVTVHDHVATLHGDVGCRYDARRIEGAVRKVCGVRGVNSVLHIGLRPGDTRPSVGHERPQPPSPLLSRLLDGARSAGAAQAPLFALHAVLHHFLDRLPDDERSHVMVHLPADVRVLVHPPYRDGEPLDIETPEQLFDAVAATDLLLTRDTAEAVARDVLDALVDAIPEETADVAAVLPPPLRELWEGSGTHVP